jgi:hypothetical protein
MKSRTTWRNGFGLAQIMALLLVVLPTMAFIVTFLLDYWALMRIDNNLKLIANMATSRLNGMSDLSVDVNASLPENQLLQDTLSSFCPNGKGVGFAGSRKGDGAGKGYIEVSVSYDYNGTYLKDKNLVTKMTTYSYHDQNATIELSCK